jgi:hypothetical protein
MNLKFKTQCKGYWSFDDDNNSNAQKMKSKKDFHLLVKKMHLMARRFEAPPSSLIDSTMSPG